MSPLPAPSSSSAAERWLLPSPRSWRWWSCSCWEDREEWKIRRPSPWGVGLFTVSHSQRPDPGPADLAVVMIVCLGCYESAFSCLFCCKTHEMFNNFIKTDCSRLPRVWIDFCRYRRKICNFHIVHKQLNILEINKDILLVKHNLNCKNCTDVSGHHRCLMSLTDTQVTALQWSSSRPRHTSWILKRRWAPSWPPNPL